jgi:hypothetical protein
MEVDAANLAETELALAEARVRATDTNNLHSIGTRSAPVAPAARSIGAQEGVDITNGSTTRGRVDRARAFYFRALDDEEDTRLIVEKLEERTDLPFECDTPLDEFLTYVREKTTDEKLPKGLPIYYDEVGVYQAGKDWNPNTVRISLNVRLRTCLRLALRQHDLVYIVKEGVLIISAPEADSLLSEIEMSREKRDAP